MTTFIVILGPPGVGKGTQAKILSERTGLAHISSGELFRENIKNQTELGRLAQTYMTRGELVPDDVTIGMIRERLGRPDYAIGAILDDFPRTPAQADELDIMLAWGAPIAVPDHAARGCAAALEIQATVERLNVGWRERGLPHVAIGVGLNTGSAIVGNFGSERRFSYTAIGDTVNLASRLEGLNKTDGTHLLISNETRQATGEAFECREVGEVTVRGRKGSTGVYELLGRRDAADVDPASQPG